MRITRNQLRQIIQEELGRLNEALTPAGLASILNRMFKKSRARDDTQASLLSSLDATASTTENTTVVSFTLDSVEQYNAWSTARYDGPRGNSLVLNIEDKMQNDIGEYRYEGGTDLLGIGRDSAFPLKVQFSYSNSTD